MQTILKRASLAAAAVIVAFAFTTASAQISQPQPAACLTILPSGESCMPNEKCIRNGGECAIEQPVAPIVCKCVV